MPNADGEQTLQAWVRLNATAIDRYHRMLGGIRSTECVDTAAMTVALFELEKLLPARP